MDKLTFFLVMLTPSNIISPLVGTSSKLMHLKRVDFPHPEGPIITNTSFF